MGIGAGKKLKFGIIGCGAIGRCHANVITSIDFLELTAVCDTNPIAAAGFAAEFNCKDYTDTDAFLAADMDAIAICLPPALHCEIVLKAAAAGKHILCEKPLAIEIDDAKQMIACCKQHHVSLGVIFQHRYDEAAIAIMQSIARGDIGRILWASTHCILYRAEEYYTATKWHADAGSGALLNQSIHYIDLLLAMMGKAVSVNGKCLNRLNFANISHAADGSDVPGTEDVGLAIVGFEDGAHAVIEGTTTSYPGLYTELSIYGENGTFIIRNDKLFAYELKSGPREEFDRLLDPSAIYTRFRDASVDTASHRAQYLDFCDAIFSGKEPAVNGTEALKSLELIHAIYSSSRSGETVCL